PKRRIPPPSRLTRALLVLNAVAAVCVASLALGQDAPFVGPLPDVDAPLADPVVSADATFVSAKATAWNQGDIRLLLLEGDVVFRLGTYGFRGDRVVVRIDTQTRYRRQIQHLAIYFEDARTLHGAGRIHAEGPGLLVTASTTGGVTLDTSLMIPADAAPDDPLVTAAAARIASHRERLATAPAPPIDAGDPLFTPDMERLRAQRRAAIAEQQIARQVASLPR